MKPPLKWATYGNRTALEDANGKPVLGFYMGDGYVGDEEEARAIAATTSGETIRAAAEMLELLREIATEGYMTELIAHKVVSGLRYQEEQECFGKIQALLAGIDKRLR